MDLSVLGNSSRYLIPLGAGTSYLVEEGDARVLLDCGNGTHLRLAQRLAGKPLSAVVVSHFHLDNMMDLFPVVFSLPAGTPLLIPAGAEPRFSDLLSAYSMDRSWIRNAHVVAVAQGDVHDAAGLRLRFEAAHHGCPGVVVRVEAGERSLTYLADTGMRSWLPGFARETDLLVAHTLLLDKDAQGEAGETNLSAGAAGRLAAEAGARRLAISHIPFYLRARDSVEEARAFFAGEVVVLEEGRTYAVGG